uniref:Putative hemocyanin n=1 Tax=Lutzomyia longipalpis TaxID=7200 RepID=A0A1B0CF09_LUTLO
MIMYIFCLCLHVGRPGANTIRRRSTESNVTIPFERTFRDLDTNRPAAGTDAEAQFTFCGCGWPQHMLIPKGTPEGLRCELFVMLTNYEEDRVEQDLVGTCNDAFSFCGVRDRLYPDRRPMGFPFDRLPRQGADRLNTFLTPNMSVTDVTIFNNETLPQAAQAAQTTNRT